MSDVCTSAPTLPTTMVTAASAAMAGPQSSWAWMKATSNMRRKTANAAALVAVAMNAVIGVGAPW